MLLFPKRGVCWSFEEQIYFFAEPFSEEGNPSIVLINPRSTDNTSHLIGDKNKV
jgi:hypothetical protein